MSISSKKSNKNRHNSTPSGERLYDDPFEYYNSIQKPFYENISVPIMQILFFTSGLLLLLAIILNELFILAFVTCFWIYRSFIMYDTWLKTAKISISKLECPDTVTVNQQFLCTIEVESKCKKNLDNFIIGVNFEGSNPSYHYLPMPSFTKKSKVELKLPANCGVGTFYIKDIKLMIRDSYGFFSKTLLFDNVRSIQVIPQTLAIAPIKRKNPDHHGFYGELLTKEYGHSNDFLGVRPWQNTDGFKLIDWKHSAKLNQLIAKQFEKTSSSRASIFFDQSRFGNHAYMDVSCYDYLCTSILSISRQLTEQNIQYNLFAPDQKFVDGIGWDHYNHCKQLIIQSKCQSNRSIIEYLDEQIDNIPSHALVFLCLFSSSINFTQLLELVEKLNVRQNELVLIVIDSYHFSKKVISKAKISIESYDQALMKQVERYSGSTLRKTLNQIADRSIIITPYKNLEKTLDRGLAV